MSQETEHPVFLQEPPLNATHHETESCMVVPMQYLQSYSPILGDEGKTVGKEDEDIAHKCVT